MSRSVTATTSLRRAPAVESMIPAALVLGPGRGLLAALLARQNARPRAGRSYTGSMNRLLLITYGFPPVSRVQSQDAAKLAKGLAQRGWEVHVLTVADPPTYLLDESCLLYTSDAADD